MSVARVSEHSNLFDDIIITSKFKIRPMQCKMTTGISNVKAIYGLIQNDHGNFQRLNYRVIQNDHGNFQSQICERHDHGNLQHKI